MIQWQRKKSSGGERPLYSFEELNSNTLRVTRDFEGRTFKRDFSVGHRFTTYNGLPVEMVSLNPNGGSSKTGYYLIVREITRSGLGKKTDVSAQNQIDKLYFNQDPDAEISSPHEVKEKSTYVEGAVKQVLVNQYERDPKARAECIRHYKCVCNICNFDFAKHYGSYGEGFIEVHHIKPLHEIKSSYVVDPINDLIPVCSNCHSMLHRGKEALSIRELKAIFHTQKDNT
ncbi:HNH endonuclease [Vibrio parahaemolyticus]|uniref:HNH endonuclease n=1 Tax=Vibrio parahaemolyticus TaxID=670 RepID=UPI00111D086C|nr:HNH endonuclease [Vibrio parahaemolyticus]EIZ0312253.1 HNH endonuclease [Vibrio parahaemolyticus]ELB2157618.1 HNH endonuclease [Vibrio parahaemolyticus]MCD2151933.1 HNH endonuclease [Vibrio parahaemolyticus]TOK86962.1 HNH endonuclease [Vibrio parahaemolyticus]HCE3105440.1 HNH endonuclease [Vibrio parahaemolyticus]